MSAIPTVREVDGVLVIEWPEPRPRSFEISAEVFEQLIDRINSSLPDAPVAAGGEVEARRPPGVAISDAALRRQLSGEGSAAADPSTPLRPS